MNMIKRAILIAGPTASGKSETALKVAEELNGEIINTDSMQVYKGLDIIVAQPRQTELEKIPHALYGFRDPAKSFSVARWMEEAKKAADEAWENGRLPIFTGGTGLYFKALVDGISDIPEVPEHIRLSLGRRLRNEGLEALYDELQGTDPKIWAQLKPNDKQRILRALCVFEATEKPLSFWQTQEKKPVLEGASLLKIVLQSPPEELNEKILTRLKGMFDRGALGEARAFQEKKLDPSLPATKALGLRPLLKHLAREASTNEALELAVIETRQYAKRQRTWFRNQFQDWYSVAAGEAAANKILSLAKTHFKD
ncbi:MAG: tRNA (adenosine(37)-N6)-dimethylallyltransferase MiaA [Sphingomonadales bacterium]